MPIRFSLVGRRSHRTPLSYPAYRELLGARLVEVDPAHRPDILVFGTRDDIPQEQLAIETARRYNSAVRVVVLSEEPFWDFLWGGDFREKNGSLDCEFGSVSYAYLNHLTSKIFEFESIPYFITTDDHFLARYCACFKRNIELSVEDFIRRWRDAPIQTAFFAERRLNEKFDEVLAGAEHICGLSRYRSLLAIEYNEPGTVKIGKGWGKKGIRRQSLPDWHLDKLTRLDGNARLVSALENTHLHSYITEKLVDAYAVGAVPMYYAGPEHRVTELCPSRSFLNLYGMTPEEAVETIRTFSDSESFAQDYIADQQHLALRFGDAGVVQRERLRVIAEIFKELQDIL